MSSPWQRLRRYWRKKWNIESLVYAPPGDSGGVKSLYTVCDWLKALGKSTIAPFDGPGLVSWFTHSCELYDCSYRPDVIIYPEIYQPHLEPGQFHICYALGKYKPIEPHADLVVCKSADMMDWVKGQQPNLPAVLIQPSIERSIFEYDGRPKRDLICYMTRPHKYPETAALLRDHYGSKLVEIVNQPEAAVAETLKSAKVFVWRGNDKEGSPRPPKEALVAGCVVVGLESDLNERLHTNFGVKCATVDELIRKAGEALAMPLPTPTERAVVRDSRDEKRDWIRLLKSRKVRRKHK